MSLSPFLSLCLREEEPPESQVNNSYTINEINENSIHFVEVRVLLFCVNVCMCVHMHYTIIRYGFDLGEKVIAASRKLDPCSRALIMESNSSNNGGRPSLQFSGAKSSQQLT